MTINALDLAAQVIKPTLAYLDMYSHAAERLLLGTAAQQSDFDPFCQCGTGFGIYQISSKQHRCVWDCYLAFETDLASKVRGLASQRQFLDNPDLELTTNLSYSTAIAWLIYRQADSQLPAADDIDGLSHLWEDHFCQHNQHQAVDFARWITANMAA